MADDEYDLYHDEEEDVEFVFEDNPINEAQGGVHAPVDSSRYLAGAAAAASSSSKTVLDISAVGDINGESILDFDLDGTEDKPWRKPGADLTDYFNFGFNESSWKLYCQKQKNMREEMAHPGASRAGASNERHRDSSLGTGSSSRRRSPSPAGSHYQPDRSIHSKQLAPRESRDAKYKGRVRSILL
jgi:hypothetical protein